MFLNGIGGMPLPLRAKRLRVLPEREVEPFGSNQVLAVADRDHRTALLEML